MERPTTTSTDLESWPGDGDWCQTGTCDCTHEAVCVSVCRRSCGCPATVRLCAVHRDRVLSLGRLFLCAFCLSCAVYLVSLEPLR
jgi:hypothetical protein